MARKRKKKKKARKADKYDLYQQSVQVPEAEVKFFNRVFRRAYGRPALVLREDFCGTAAICCEWARSRRDRVAYGVDNDPEPLEWGRRHNLAPLPEAAQERVHLLEQDVRKVNRKKADVVGAENFSYFCFHTRDALREYFKAARRNLAREGVLVLDIMGGSEVIEENRRERRKVDGFRYIWEHDRFDPVSNLCRYHIHFKFKDGSKLRRAFTYDWRLWSIPEVRELLAEAGFKSSEVYWEGTDKKTGEGNGVYRVCDHADSDPSWISYIVGIK